MQVGSSNDLAKQMQALQNAALGQSQGGGSEFSLLMQTGGSGFSPAISSGSSGSAAPGAGQQSKSEGQAVAKAGRNAYADALQNFLTLSQASGQLAGGMVSANFDTSLTLKPAGGGVPATAAS